MNTTIEEREVYTCYDCDQQSFIEMVEVYGHSICPNCLRENYTQCRECEEYFDYSDITEVDNRSLCDDCLRENYTRCNECRDWTSNDDSIYINGEDIVVCESCYQSEFSVCPECGDTYRDNCLSHVNGSYICDSCISENYFTCELCGECCPLDDMSASQDSCICVNCHQEQNRVLLSSAPSPIFFGKINPKNQWYYGIELETENIPMDSFEDLKDNSDEYFYGMTDCSLDETGIEIISHPATFDWIQDNWNDTWKKVCGMTRVGGKSYEGNRCGCHIHVSKKNISSLDLFKIHMLFMKNVEFIKRISQRTDTITNDNITREWNYWCKIDWNMDTPYSKQRVYDVCREKFYPSQKYRAINLMHEHTIEFRVFRGTLNEHSLKKNIQFIDALLHFVKVTSIRDITVESFYSYIKNKKEYKECKEWIQKKCKEFFLNAFQEKYMKEKTKRVKKIAD